MTMNNFDVSFMFEPNFPYVKRRGLEIGLELTEGFTLIPSHTYPLTQTKNIKVHHFYNTKALKDLRITKVFDAIHPDVSRGYSNAEALHSVLTQLGIPNVKYMVGWVISGPSERRIKHHAWVLYEDEYVLDFSDSHIVDKYHGKFFNEENSKKREEEGLTKEEILHRFQDGLIEVIEFSNKMLNHEHRVFGKPLPNRLYIGVESDAVEGRQAFNKLMESYSPKHPHPSYPNYFLNKEERNGRSAIQQLLHEKKKD